MFSSFLGQFGTALGKDFLFTGFIPAAVYLLGLRWYVLGSSGLASMSVFDSKTTSVAVLTLISVGLLFFASRRVLLDILQRLPGAPLQPLREWLIRREIARYRKLRNEKDRLLSWLTAIDWPKGGFQSPGFLPPWAVREFSTYTALCEARRGFRMLQRLTVTRDNGGILSWGEDVSAVASGIWSLYLLAGQAKEDPAYAIHQREWEALLNEICVLEPNPLSEVRRVVNARWVEVFGKCKNLPDDEWATPTRLGSQFAALEAYAKKRYCIDTSALWVRLWGVLSSDEKKTFAETQLRIDTAVTACWSLAALAVSVLVSWAMGIRPEHPTIRPFTFAPVAWAGTFVIGGFALSRLAYFSAVYVFGSFAEGIIRVIDLHRLELLEQLGYEAPTRVSEELIYWRELRQFFTQGKPKKLQRKLRLPAKDSK
jgi:hypothetical protein